MKQTSIDGIRWDTVFTVEQIEQKINECDKNIEIFNAQVEKQKNIKNDLLLLKLQAERDAQKS